MLLVLLCALAGYGFCVPAAMAQDGGLFTVTGIELDETAGTAEAARQQALAKARRIAFDSLVERLVAPGERDAVPLPGGDRLRAMVSSVSVEEERFSTTRYIATVSVTFARGALVRLFDQAGVAYTKAQAKPRLVIPLFEQAGAFQLWGDDNPWAAALSSSLAENRLMPYRFARGDTGDRRQLPAARAAAVDEGALKALAKRYGAARVVLAKARLTRDYRVNRQVVEYSYTVWPRGGAGEGRVVAGANESRNGLLRRAADQIYDRIDAQWAVQTRVRADSEFSLAVRVPASSLEEWQEIRRRLSGAPLVSSVAVDSVGVPVSRFTVRFFGTYEKLQAAVAEAGLSLMSGPKGYALTLAESEFAE